MTETDQRAPKRISVQLILAKHAEERGTSDALAGDYGRVSYADLLDRVERAAEWFVQEGLSPNVVTAVAISDEAIHILTALALLCLGCPQINLPSHETGESKRSIAAKVGVGQIVA